MSSRILVCAWALALPFTAHGAVTGSAGFGQAFSNEQPSLGLNYLVRTTGTYEELGEVALFAGDFAPVGWADAAGQLLPISQNQALFDKLGTSFGGDGDISFALPDLRGRTAIGAGSGPGLPSYALGQMVGSQQQTLDFAPEHSHAIGGGYSTDSTGVAAAHSNMQPSLALTPVISLTGLFPSRSALPADGEIAEGLSPSGEEPFLGEIAWLAHDDVPAGWAHADGQVLQIVENEALFALLGTQYGGDGRITFALPDLRGRAAVGMGQGPGLSNRGLGAEFGSADEVLTAQQMPAHTHDLPAGGETDASGASVAQSNLQPSLAINYSVALVGHYPSQNSPPAEASDGDLAEAIGGSSYPYYASVPMFGFNFNPRGFALANGQLLPVSQNTALFSLLWTTYGGNGQTNFALPDLRGRVPVGDGSGAGPSPVNLGQKFGQESSILTEANLPAHTHTFSIPGDYNDDGQVDAADYAVWRNHYGESAGALPNDTTGAAIGQQQYDVWRANFGAPHLSPSPADTALNAPEPNAFWLAALVSLAATAARRTRPQ